MNSKIPKAPIAPKTSMTPTNSINPKTPMNPKIPKILEKKAALYSGAIPSTTFIEQLVHALAQQEGVEILLFGRQAKAIQYQKPNIRLYPTPTAPLRLIIFTLIHGIRLAWRYPEDFRKLRRHIRACGAGNPKEQLKRWGKYLPVVLHLPDIFHIQWAKSASEWLFLKELFGVKLLLSLRGAHINYSPIADPKLGAEYRQVFPQLDGFHAVSRAIACEAQQWGAEEQKVKVVYSGLDLQKISAFQKQDWQLGQPIRMLSVGRFHWKKGYHYALDAQRLLRDKGHDIHYTLIASGASEEIPYQIRDLGLEQYVEIIPGLPQQEVFQKMAESDLLLLPSVEEGIANVVLEAMAIGLPVASSNCGGMGEVMEDGVNGFLFENRNVKNMADCIETLIRLSPAKRAAMAESARRLVAERHSLEGLGRNMMELYESV